MKGLVLTYVVTALASIGALRKPLIGLYAYVGFAVLRPQFIFGWAGDLGNQSLLLGCALIAGWVFNGFGSWTLGRAKAIVLVLFGYTTWYTLSALNAGNVAVSLPAVTELLKIVVPFCVGVTMMNEERDWKTMLWVIVLAEAYVGLEMNVNYLRGNNTAADGFGGMDNNCFGAALVTVLGVAIALVIASRKWYERGAAAIAAALILHTTLLTFSRGAMVGLLCIAGAAFVALPKRPKYLAVMAVAALLALRLTGPQLMARYATTFAGADERDASAESRLQLWTDCIKVIQANPMFGVGPRNWPLVAASYGWSAGKSAHSVWMESAADVGLPGALLLLSFFVLAAMKLWPMARARLSDGNDTEIAVAMGVMLAAVGFVTAGQFVSVEGLEAPYYIVMIGAATLRVVGGRAVATELAAPAGTSPVLTVGPLPLVAVRPAAPRPRAVRPERPRLLPDLGPRPSNPRAADLQTRAGH